MRSFLLFAILITCGPLLACDEVPADKRDPKKITPESVVGYAFKFGAEYVAGKALDRAFGLDGKPDIDRIDGRLQVFEEQLRLIDGNLASTINSLRNDLNDRTSKEAIAKVVEEALRELRSKMDSQLHEFQGNVDSQLRDSNAKIDSNLQNANAKIGQIDRQANDLSGRLLTTEKEFADLKRKMEDCFGYLPPLPPAPVTFSDSRGFLHEPIVEPLIADYLRLVVKSEQNRLKMSMLMQLHTEASKDLQVARAEDRQLQAQSCDLYLRAKSNLAIKTLDRKELLQTYTKNHFKIQDVDRKLSSASWVVSSCKPVEQAEGSLRVPVPTQLFSDKPGAIVASFQLAGGDPAELAPLFRMRLQSEVIGEGSRSAKRFLERVGYLDVDRKSLEKELSTNTAILNFSSKAFSTLDRAAQISAKIWLQESKNQRDLNKLGKLNPEIEANRKSQTMLLKELEYISSELDSTLTRGLQGYLRLLASEKETASHIRGMYGNVLIPLASAAELMQCSDWNSPTCQADTWRKVYDKANATANIEPGNYLQLESQEIHSLTTIDLGKTEMALTSSGCEIRVKGKSQEIVITALANRENGRTERIETGTIRVPLERIQCVWIAKGGVGLCDDANHLDLYGFDGTLKRSLQLPFSPISMDASGDGTCLALLSKDGKLSLFNPSRNREECCFYLEKPARRISVLDSAIAGCRCVVTSVSQGTSREINDAKNLDFILMSVRSR